MILWARCRRIHVLVGVVVLVTVLRPLLSGTGVALPVLTGHPRPTPWAMFLPVLVGVAVADSMASKTQAVEAQATNRVLLLDVALLLTTSVAASVALAGGSTSVGQVLVCVGGATVATLMAGVGAGVLAPFALAVACVVWGSDAPGGAYVRLLAPDASPGWTLVVGSASLAVAGGLVLTRSVRVTTRRTDGLLDR